MSRCALVLALCVSTLACATSFRDRAWLNQQLGDRVGASSCEQGSDSLPPQVDVEDGIDEAEVVSIALCRNPLLQAELTRIDFALAALDDAGRPANPQLTLAGPIGPVAAVAT